MTKHTRYFENYQEAYNYYGGTNVPSKEIALVGDASYVFVSSDNAGDGGNTQYFDAAMTNDEIVATQVDAAYVSGTTQGYEQGYNEGYPLGYTAGHTAGYTEGETAGYDAGHSAGYAEGEAEGYNNGHSAGYADGEADYIAGMIENGTMAITTTSQVDVMEYAYAQVSDANLTAGNIADGVTILGVTGSYNGLVPSGTAYINANTFTDVTSYAYAYCTASGGGAEVPYNEQYLTLEAFDVDDKGMPGLEITNNGVDISYKVDDGSWTSITSGSSATIGIAEGTKVMLKGNNNTLWVDDGNDAYCGLVFVGSDASFKAYGNIMSLLAGDNFISSTTLNTGYTDQFHGLFIDFAALKHAKDIVFPSNEATRAYNEMFSGCANLEDVPVFCPAPAGRAAVTETYVNMFTSCDNLKYVVVVTDQAIATSATGEPYDTLQIGVFGSNLTNAYLVVQSSQVAHVKEAVEANGLDNIVLGYDSTKDSDCYSTDAETFCLRMAAKYLPDEKYNEGYDNGYAEGEYSASLDPTSSIVTDASKWQVYDHALNVPPVAGLTMNDQPIETMDVEGYAEVIASYGDPNAIVIVDKFNPRGSDDNLSGIQDVSISYQRNDPEDPDTNAYISIDIDSIEEGESVGLSFANLTEDGDGGGVYFLDNIYWCIDNNASNNHWLMTANVTGTYTIRLDANGNGGCTMTITEPEPEP